MLKKLVCCLCIGFVFSFVYSQEEQRTTVVKSVTSNPSVGIVKYSGDEKTKAKLLDVLERCGWFNVVHDSQAEKADVKLDVVASDDGAIRANVEAGTNSFATEQHSGAGNMPVYETVDDILRSMFKVRSFCTQKIYFVVTGQGGKKEIYSCFLDGSGQERVTFNNAISTEPGWGHKNALVYTMAKNNTLSVILADVANGRQRIVSRAPGLNASAGLSHDGQKVALSMSADKQVDIYVIDLASGGQRERLTADKNVESSPCWSPDNGKICYVSDKLGVPQLYLIEAVAGARERRISTGNNECVSPDWSNVSNKLCFSMKSNTGQRVIAVIDMSDANFNYKIVTHAAGNWEAPCWAPDGRHLVCTREDASGRMRDLYIVDTWSNAFRPISKGAKLSLPAWRPAY